MALQKIVNTDTLNSQQHTFLSVYVFKAGNEVFHHKHSPVRSIMLLKYLRSPGNISIKAQEMQSDGVPNGVESGKGHCSPSSVWQSSGYAPRKIFKKSIMNW